MGIIDSITSVFSDIMVWFANSFGTIQSMFYNADSGLTFLGTLAVCGLAISVFFLLMGILQRFLHFGG